MIPIRKYPRTPHLEGSKLQSGDTTEGQISISALRKTFPEAHFIVEEKLDGANAGIFFDGDLNLRLQSRGHVLAGGAREGQFALMKQWAVFFEADLLERLEDRYVMYGEWMYAKHTVFYDALPHLFFEFDILDRTEDRFLSTPERRRLLEGLPIASAPVISESWPKDRRDLEALVQPSLYRTPDWREALVDAAIRSGVDPEVACAETDGSDLSEGIYIKIETDTETIGRFKWVRRDFLQAIQESGSHWQERPVIRNRLAEGVDLMPTYTQFSGAAP